MICISRQQFHFMSAESSGTTFGLPCPSASNRRDFGRLWSFHPKIIKSFSFAVLLKCSTLKKCVPEGIKPLVRHSKGFSSN